MLKVFLLIFSTLSTFTVLEVAARIYGSQAVFAWRDYRGQALNLYKMRLPVQFDPLLGWIPKVGYSTTDNKWSTRVTIIDHGVRSNGNGGNEILDKTPILAVGDSFTFGDEVSDSETWPAILERLLHKKVINAGVFAYGIDQTFLRLNMLLKIYAPDTIIFSFIPHDIGRAAYATAMGANKPYFVVSNNTLVLMNSPVKIASTRPVTTLHRALGYSYLIHKLMMRLNPSWWIQGYKWNENRTDATGEEIACLIFRELKAMARQKKVRNVYVLVQYHADLYPGLQSRVDRVKACIDPEAITIIDLKSPLMEVKRLSPEKYNAFFRGHMTYEGNAFVAENIANSMKQGF